VKDIIRKIYVVLPVTVSDLEAWKALSPVHFYVRYKFPSLKSLSWVEDFSSLEPKNVPYCDRCFSQNEKEITSLVEFSAQFEPLRALDLFAGVGAFALGMELSCPMKLTHAIEISPSAARTMEYVHLYLFPTALLIHHLGITALVLLYTINAQTKCCVMPLMFIIRLRMMCQRACWERN
jgi:hypothetical protein